MKDLEKSAILQHRNVSTGTCQLASIKKTFVYKEGYYAQIQKKNSNVRFNVHIMYDYYDAGNG